MASGTPSAQVRIPVENLFFLRRPRTYAHTILLGEKLSGGVKLMRRQNNHPAAKKLCGRRIIIRWRNKNPRRARVGQKFEKKPNSAENTPFHILIHCETFPYPYAIPKTLS